MAGEWSGDADLISWGDIASPKEAYNFHSFDTHPPLFPLASPPQIRANEKSLDLRCAEIQDLYTLVDEYQIPVPAMDRAAYGTLESTYTNLKTVMEEVENAKEENISKYSSSLEAGGCGLVWDRLSGVPFLLLVIMPAALSGIEVVNKEVKEIRNSAQNEMLLSEDSEREKVVEYLLALKEQVDAQTAEAARINKYQTLFKVIMGEPLGMRGNLARQIPQ